MDERVASPLKPTITNAVRSKCHECMGHYYDGRVDCENTACSLYSHMPYRKLEPDTMWTKYNPKVVGLVERTTRVLSDEEREVIRERFVKAREARGKQPHNI